MSIHFFFNKIKITLKKKKRLKLFITNIFTTEGKEIASLAIILCTDKYLLDVNRAFLKHDNYTDIITFNLAKKNEPIEGEIYISAERVIENASIHRVSVQNELHRVIFHGVLHLCGLKDKKPTQKKSMTAAENSFLSLYFS